MRFFYLLIAVLSFSFIHAGSVMTLDKGKTPILTDSHRLQSIESRLDHIEKTGFQKDNAAFGFLSLDYLYWRAQMNNWVYTDELLSGTFGQDGGNPVSKSIMGEPAWKSGIRVAVGFSNLFDWTITGVWTYLHNKSTSQDDHSNQVNSYVMLEHVSLSKTTSLVNFHIGDIELASNYLFSKTVSFRPVLGIRGAWIKNNMHLMGLNLPAIAKTLFDHNFHGYGLRAGAFGAYLFGCSGLEIFGGFSASLLYGKVKTTNLINVTGEADPTENQTVTALADYNDLKSTIQLMAGLNWKYKFDCDSKSFGIHAAWEMNYWWDQMDNFQYIFMGSEGGFEIIGREDALIFSGVNVGMTFEY